MRMHFARITCCFFLAFLAYSANAKNPVIFISIDGLREDAIARSKAPFMNQLKKDGLYFDQATTVRPSITLPAHTSMLTGLDPEIHGIWWDDYRPYDGPIKHETFLEIANNKGMHTAMFVAKDKLIHLNRENSVDYFEKTEKSGEAVATAFENYVNEKGLPDISFLHLPDPDKAGHFLVWMSPFYMNGVLDADDAVKKIVDIALKARPDEEPLIIITADHGGCGFMHLADIDQNNKVPFIVKGPNVPKNIVRHDLIKVYDVAPTILSFLQLAIPDGWQGQAIDIFAH